jgi:hypothetical protein
MTRRVVALTVLLFAAPVAAESARQILDRQRALEDRERRWVDRHQTLRIEVLDPRRAPRQLAVELFDKKYPARQQRTMAYFTAPDAVKGTAFLAVSHPDRPDEQWLYLPEHRRARRIGGAARTQGLVGTDFTYHDLDLLAEMPAWTDGDASSQLRGDETIDGVPCHVIELTPQRADIGYQRIVVWLGRDDLVARQIELYVNDASEPPTRRVRQSDVRKVGSIPVPHRAEVETPSAGTKTILIFTDVAFDQNLPDELFNQPALEWGSYP